MVSSTFSFVEVVIVNFTLTGVATDTLFASPAFAVSLISLPFIFAVKYWVYLASTSHAECVKRIESEMEYPGQIKVNVIRETRAVEFAK